MVYKYHRLIYKENTKFAAAKDRTSDQQPTPAQSFKLLGKKILLSLEKLSDLSLE
jgi:hypothetical protein